MSRQVQSQVTVEIELTCVGNFQPGYPETGPTYSCGGEPAEPDGIEDVEITHATMSVRNPDWRYGQPLLNSPSKWLDKSIFDGVDMKSPDIVKLLANIAQYAADEIDGALIDEAGE